jgi:hypothetical protein
LSVNQTPQHPVSQLLRLYFYYLIGNIMAKVKTLALQLPAEPTAAAPTHKPSFLGDIDGINVTQFASGGVHGFEIAMPFDRALIGMLSELGQYDKVTKLHFVPIEKTDELGVVLSDMRLESGFVKTQEADIKALAKASGELAQRSAGLRSATVVPQVSGFREPGKIYTGEIVNANSRFAAQFSGFGKQDGAAFLTIHRLDDLNRDLMKGDRVGIVYDDKYLGEVTDVVLQKSPAAREAEYQNNLGKTINGVTIVERDNKIAVGFKLGPVLYARIKQLEGATFNKESAMWEIPLAKKEFVQFAVQDMRDEFAIEQADADMLFGVALEKVDGAKVFDAFTQDDQEHFGKIMAVGERFALQSVGRGNFNLHHLAVLNSAPQVGQNLAIKYSKGVGAVVDQDQKRSIDKAIGAGR